MSYLSFIEDEELEKIITKVLNKGQSALKTGEEKFGRNVIDPFSILFEMGSFEIDFNQWNRNE